MTMIKTYIQQNAQYYSQSKNIIVDIATMVPEHAANAAEKMLREAEYWTLLADTKTARPILWVTTTPLFQALVARAESATMPTFVKPARRKTATS